MKNYKKPHSQQRVIEMFPAKIKNKERLSLPLTLYNIKLAVLDNVTKKGNKRFIHTYIYNIYILYIDLYINYIYINYMYIIYIYINFYTFSYIYKFLYIFIVSGFTFKTQIQFKLIFASGVRQTPNIIILHVNIQFSQHHLLK